LVRVRERERDVCVYNFVSRSVREASKKKEKGEGGKEDGVRVWVNV